MPEWRTLFGARFSVLQSPLLPDCGGRVVEKVDDAYSDIVRCPANDEAHTARLVDVVGLLGNVFAQGEAGVRLYVAVYCPQVGVVFNGVEQL